MLTFLCINGAVLLFVNLFYFFEIDCRIKLYVLGVLAVAYIVVGVVIALSQYFDVFSLQSFIRTNNLQDTIVAILFSVAIINFLGDKLREQLKSDD